MIDIVYRKYDMDRTTGPTLVYDDRLSNIMELLLQTSKLFRFLIRHDLHYHQTNKHRVVRGVQNFSLSPRVTPNYHKQTFAPAVSSGTPRNFDGILRPLQIQGRRTYPGRYTAAGWACAVKVS